MLASIKNLIIPGKASGRPEDYVTFRTYGDDMRYLETWAKQPILQLKAGANITLTPASGEAIQNGNGPMVVEIAASGGGGGGYASLTGPGQTVTPGKLTQAGDFEIDAGTTNPATAIFQDNDIDLNVQNASATTEGQLVLNISSAGLYYRSVGRFVASATTSTVDSPGTVNIGPGANVINIGSGIPGRTLGFFGATAVVQQSSFGVTTVAQLITLLKNYGLLS